ncbi:Lpg1974 family pore-forming outer membrane protein [Roseimaritima sediminicola]|uniref:Lpg1974 family pore-forming outer membrane protein n=1 Tax=Roseimaritima sediminicola TaxID=2662066 RepID=UPI0012982C86|nr:Lpg1974 family pore-forming outer membrane protein [Roseimaritima sediminicola]
MKKLVFSTIFSIGLLCGVLAQAEETTQRMNFAEALDAVDEPIQLVGHQSAINCEPCAQSCKPKPRSHYYGTMELPLLSLYANHGAGGATAFGSWFEDFDTQAALRVEAGYENAYGVGLRGRFFTFDTDGGAPNEYFDVRLYDIEATSALKLRNWDFEAFGGVRWGSIDFSDENGSLGRDFDGFGLTMGGQARRCLTQRLGLNAGVRYSALYGKNEAGPFQLDNVIVPITELRLGVDYTRMLRRGVELIAEVGYEHQMYSSLSVAPNIDPEDVDVALAGPVFSITLRR